MLVEKYKPKRLVEVAGQNSLIEKIIKWLKDWKPKKALLLYGPSGNGKTLITELIAKENRFSLVEINSGDENLVKYVKETLLPASKEGSLFNKRLILIENIDAMNDRGLIAEIIKVIKGSATPIIITANNAYSPKLRTLRVYCTLVKVNKVNSRSIEKFLRNIALRESIKVNGEMLKRIAEDSDGDVRSAINDLEAINGKNSDFGIRDREKDIFKTLKEIFQSNNITKAMQAINESDKDLDEIFWWLEQNITLELKDNDEICQAFEILSKVDLFRSRIFINRNYRYKKYMKELLAGLTLIGNNKRFVMYRPPDRLLILGRTKAQRMKDQEIYSGLSKELHCSTRKIKEQMPLLEIILRN